MNRFKVVNSSAIDGGHWWTFDREKLSSLVAHLEAKGVEDLNAAAKKICFRVRNEEWKGAEAHVKDYLEAMK